MRSEIFGNVPESCHDIEMVGPETVAPAAGDVNSTSAKTEGARAATSQANLRIIVAVLWAGTVDRWWCGTNIDVVSKLANR